MTAKSSYLPPIYTLIAKIATRSLFRQVLRHIEASEREVNLAAVFFDDVLGLEALEMQNEHLRQPVELHLLLGELVFLALLAVPLVALREPEGPPVLLQTGLQRVFHALPKILYLRLKRLDLLVPR